MMFTAPFYSFLSQIREVSLRANKTTIAHSVLNSLTYLVMCQDSHRGDLGTEAIEAKRSDAKRRMLVADGLQETICTESQVRVLKTGVLDKGEESPIPIRSTHMTFHSIRTQIACMPLWHMCLLTSSCNKHTTGGLGGGQQWSLMLGVSVRR